MDGNRFDDLLRALTVIPSRRGIARALGGLTLVAPVSALHGSPDAEAKKNKGKGKNNKTKCKGG